jgi:hypothetical protein
LGSKEVTLEWEKYSLAFDGDPSVNVYRNDRALPRAFVVHQAVVADDHEDAWQRIHQPGFDPETMAVLEGAQSLDLQPGEQAAVNVVRYETNDLEIEIDSPAQGYLILSDPFYPGWRAELDGMPVKLLRANYAFRAVAVPPGQHRVTMAFRPLSWSVGLGISVLAVLVLLALGGIALSRRRQGR